MLLFLIYVDVDAFLIETHPSCVNALCRQCTHTIFGHKIHTVEDDSPSIDSCNSSFGSNSPYAVPVRGHDGQKRSARGQLPKFMFWYVPLFLILFVVFLF